MKKLVVTALACMLLLTGCGGAKTGDTAKTEDDPKEIKIGTMTIVEPIVNMLAEGLEKDGYKITPVLFDGNHLPATALSEGSVDGVILNHKPWMETFNKENNTNLVMPEPYMYQGTNALYSNKYDDISQIPDGAKIAVPGDPINLDRSLRLLQGIGFIKLQEGKEGMYTPVDIVENTKNIEIIETEITATVRSMDDVDALFCGAAYVKEAGYDHKHPLYFDPTNKDYPLGLIVNKGDEDKPWVKKVLEYQQTQEFKDKFNEHFDQTYILYE